MGSDERDMKQVLPQSSHSVFSPFGSQMHVFYPQGSFSLPQSFSLSVIQFGNSQLICVQVHGSFFLLYHIQLI